MAVTSEALALAVYEQQPPDGPPPRSVLDAVRAALPDVDDAEINALAAQLSQLSSAATELGFAVNRGALGVALARSNLDARFPDLPADVLYSVLARALFDTR